MVTRQTQPTNIAPKPFILKDKNGNRINKILLASGVVATIVGYDQAKKTFILSVPDTADNKKKYHRTNNPKKKRTDSGEESETMTLIKQEWDKGNLPISISLNPKKNGQMPTVKQLEDGSFQIDMTAREFSAQRSLMHIDHRSPEEKTAEKEQEKKAQAVAEQATKQKESWLSRHWGKLLLVLLAIATICVLGFRKGGWWNKKKKSNSSKSKSATTETKKTEPTKSSVAQMNTVAGINNSVQITTMPPTNTTSQFVGVTHAPTIQSQGSNDSPSDGVTTVVQPQQGTQIQESTNPGKEQTSPSASDSPHSTQESVSTDNLGVSSTLGNNSTTVDKPSAGTSVPPTVDNSR